MDVLGESTQSERDAAEKLKHYKQVVDASKSGLSVKLTELGMDLDEEVCRRNLKEIVEYAARDRFVRVDMEDFFPYGRYSGVSPRDARAP